MDYRHNDGERNRASSSHQDSSPSSARRNKFLRIIGLSQNQCASQEGQSFHNEISNLEKMTKYERSKLKQEIRKQEKIIQKEIEGNYEKLDQAQKVQRWAQLKAEIARKGLKDAEMTLECNIYVKKQIERDKAIVSAKRADLEKAKNELNEHTETVESLKSRQNKLNKGKKRCKDRKLSLEFLSVYEDILKEYLNNGQILMTYDILANIGGEENTRFAHLQNTEEYKVVEKSVKDMFQTWKKQNKM
jgi:hypothetical protein